MLLIQLRVTALKIQQQKNTDQCVEFTTFCFKRAVQARIHIKYLRISKTLITSTAFGKGSGCPKGMCGQETSLCISLFCSFYILETPAPGGVGKSSLHTTINLRKYVPLMRVMAHLTTQFLGQPQYHSHHRLTDCVPFHALIPSYSSFIPSHQTSSPANFMSVCYAFPHSPLLIKSENLLSLESRCKPQKGPLSPNMSCLQGWSGIHSDATFPEPKTKFCLLITQDGPQDPCKPLTWVSTTTRLWSRASPYLEKSKLCQCLPIWQKSTPSEPCNITLRWGKSDRGNVLPNLSFKWDGLEACCDDITGRKILLRAATGTTAMPALLWQAGYFWTWPMKQHFVDYELHPLNIPFTSNLGSRFLAQSSKTSMGYIMKCRVTSVQKGQAYKSFLIGKSLQ